MPDPTRPYITIIVGSGRDLVQAGPLYRELRRRARAGVGLVLTGEERDADLMTGYFRGLSLPQPDGLLEPGPGSRTEQTARILQACETFLRHSPTTLAVLLGATDSIIACALVCKQHGLPVAHLEAGLRSPDAALPQDTICEVVDHLADHWFAPWAQAAAALQAEGIPPERVVQPGPLMVDTLRACRYQAASTSVWDELRLAQEEFGIVALTSPRLLDVPTNLRKIADALAALAGDIPVVWPLSTQARRRLDMWHLDAALRPSPDLRLPDSRGFLDTFGLIGRALFLVTDSGDLQDQASFLGVPCLTVAEATDRPITLERGTNILIGPDTAALVSHCQAILEGRRLQASLPQDWDGAAAGRIADALEEIAGAHRPGKRGSA